VIHYQRFMIGDTMELTGEFNNQTAIVEVREKDNVIYAKEMLYQSGLNYR
jgi:hypothetical protein